MFFTIYLNPVPKARPRFSKKSKRTFTPAKTKNFEKAIRKHVERQLGESFPLPMYPEGQGLYVAADFVFERIKALEGKKHPDGLIWKTTKPDLDNLAKAILDGLNKVLWADDNQVVDVRIRKFYAERYGKPRVAISVLPIEDPPQATCDFWNADLLDLRAGRKEPSGKGE